MNSPLALILLILSSNIHHVFAIPTGPSDAFKTSSQSLQLALTNEPFEQIVSMVKSIENGCAELSRCYIPSPCKKRVEDIENELRGIVNVCITDAVVGGRRIFRNFLETIKISVQTVDEMIDLATIFDFGGFRDLPPARISEINELISIMDSDARGFQESVKEHRKQSQSIIKRIEKAREKSVELANASTKELQAEREAIISDGDKHFNYLMTEGSSVGVREMWNLYKDNVEKQIDILFDCLTYKIVLEKHLGKGQLIWSSCRAKSTYTVRGSDTVYTLPLSDKLKSEQVYGNRLGDTLDIITSHLDVGLKQFEIVSAFLVGFQSQLEELRIDQQLRFTGQSRVAYLARLNQVKTIFNQIEGSVVAYLSSNREELCRPVITDS